MTDPAPLIRDAVARDMPDIFRLVRGLAEYERKLDEFVVTEPLLRDMLFGPAPRLAAILAEDPQGAAVGIALFYYTVSTFSGRPGIFLEDLFVEPAHRGTGFGVALLQHLAARAVAETCEIIEWRVLNWNQPAIEFYERIGAVPVRDWQVRQLGGVALAALAQGVDDG